MLNSSICILKLVSLLHESIDNIFNQSNLFTEMHTIKCILVAFMVSSLT